MNTFYVSPNKFLNMKFILFFYLFFSATILVSAQGQDSGIQQAAAELARITKEQNQGNSSNKKDIKSKSNSQKCTHCNGYGDMKCPHVKAYYAYFNGSSYEMQPCHLCSGSCIVACPNCQPYNSNSKPELDKMLEQVNHRNTKPQDSGIQQEAARLAQIIKEQRTTYTPDSKAKNVKIVVKKNNKTKATSQEKIH
jgi:Fe-S-cluster-containing dehydrogenase component